MPHLPTDAATSGPGKRCLQPFAHGLRPHPDCRQRVLLTYAMKLDIKFAPAMLVAVREQPGERGTAGWVTTITADNMTSRFLEAPQIHSDDAR